MVGHRSDVISQRHFKAVSKTKSGDLIKIVWYCKNEPSPLIRAVASRI